MLGFYINICPLHTAGTSEIWSGQLRINKAGKANSEGIEARKLFSLEMVLNIRQKELINQHIRL